MASLLDKHFRLLWHGRRTALPRHQTLSATLDWSYNLLSGTEQLVFRRLAIFVGGFSLAAALRVASEGLDPAELTETVATLVDKSLVTSDGGLRRAIGCWKPHAPTHGKSSVKAVKVRKLLDVTASN